MNRSKLVPSERIRGFLRPFIRAALDRPDERDEPHSTNEERFIFLEELVESTKDPIKLENEIIGVFAAGKGTTAAFLTWTIYFLARDPQVFDELRTAVVSQPGLTSEGITLKGLEASEYLSMVTKESLRMTAVTPTISCSSLVDITLPRGGGKVGMDPVIVLKGTEIQIRYKLFCSSCFVEPISRALTPRNSDRPFSLEFSPFSTGRRIAWVVSSLVFTCVGSMLLIFTL